MFAKVKKKKEPQQQQAISPTENTAGNVDLT